MIFTAPITGVTPDPEVYTGLVAARMYVAEMLDPKADAWLALEPNTQARSLRTATRFLDRQTWDGTATGLVGADVTTLQFPRAGLLREGVAVDSTTVPFEISEAACELAVLVASDPAIINKVDQGSNISSVGGGGGVAVSFFAPTSAANGTATRLPLAVLRLIGCFLATPAGAGDVLAQAGCSVTEASRARQYRLTRDD